MTTTGGCVLKLAGPCARAVLSKSCFPAATVLGHNSVSVRWHKAPQDEFRTGMVTKSCIAFLLFKNVWLKSHKIIKGQHHRRVTPNATFSKFTFTYIRFLFDGSEALFSSRKLPPCLGLRGIPEFFPQILRVFCQKISNSFSLIKAAPT